MPIKFRCPHCRQFLGISRGQAGSVVDCPMCGRSIRVPNLDGRVDPLPKPDWNHADSKLNEALDQLAAIGNPDPTFDPDPPEAHATAVTQEDDPDALPEAIPSTVPPAAVPVEPGPQEQLLEAEAVESPPQPAAANPKSARSDPLLALATIAEPTGAEAMPGTTLSRAVTAWRHPAVLAAMGGVGVLMFAIGYFVGQQRTQPVKTTATRVADKSNTVASAKALPSEPTESFHGRVTYQTENGTRKPDQGARVFVLPQQRHGLTRLAIAGFRDVETKEFAESVALTRALGGDVAIADPAGRYQITLPSAGDYYILILSHSLQRDTTARLEPRVESVLSEYFDRPVQLLGSCRFYMDELKFEGKRLEPFDHAFDSASSEQP